MKAPQSLDPEEYFKGFVKRLDGLGYRKRRQVLWRQVRPSLCRFLYKFRPFDPSNSTSVDRLRDILFQSRLRLSSPTEFNDPYDMAAKIIVEGPRAAIRQKLDRLFRERGVKWEARKREVSRMMANLDSVVSRARISFAESTAAVGVCSFGGDPRSILMWSHYATDHRGVCLQFEVARDIATFAQALPVNYSEDYPVLNWLNEAKGITVVLLRKYQGWAYEKERRIIVPESAAQLLYFRSAALSGIIIGCSASSATVEQLKDLVKERSSFGFPPLKIYRAFKHDSKYRLIINKDRTERGDI
ncbi:MAG: DUF2971 domain-containing protein [Deltaproteobacteria bacterium]|nr:DUF2971 domain-containing protein [Deltaproteobacteria bacterium]